MSITTNNQLNSSLVASYTYDSTTKTLSATYKAGGTYTYQGVSQAEFDSLQTATSKGKALKTVIAGKTFTK